jgi:hypothetical protein
MAHVIKSKARWLAVTVHSSSQRLDMRLFEMHKRFQIECLCHRDGE